MDKNKVRTNASTTWCPGCFNHMILAGAQQFFEEQLKSGKKKEDFAIVTGIGCHAKIFDYLDMPGMNTLHGRVPPTCIGIKLAKPRVSVFGFSGDGDAYSEGLEHTINAARYNANFKYIVHNNQVFALTLGEPTPVTETGFKDPSVPLGVVLQPINPIKLMLAAGATFVARVYAEVKQVKEVLEEAQKHKGFAFIEIIQPCIVFHNDEGYKERFYNLKDIFHDTHNISEAMHRAEEFDYSSKQGKIPMGIFYQTNKPTFEELKEKKKI
jgi:2-oxoglutarate/2-oxoacid ferredoxin oxidoreductase subunit beta